MPLSLNPMTAAEARKVLASVPDETLVIMGLVGAPRAPEDTEDWVARRKKLIERVRIALRPH